MLRSSSTTRTVFTRPRIAAGVSAPRRPCHRRVRRRGGRGHPGRLRSASMQLPRPTTPDALRPTAEAALAAWAARVDADREQVERAREVDDPADFYAPVAARFRPGQVKHPARHAGHLDPRRQEDVLALLRSLARPD